MLENISEKASLGIGWATFSTGLAAIADIIPPITALAGLALVIFTFILNKRRDKREAVLNKLKIKLLKKELEE